MLKTTTFRSSMLIRAAMAIPVLAGLTIAASAQGAPTSYTVKAGDTLWRIAGSELGDPRRWPEIQRLNSSSVATPQSLATGTVLKLPAQGASAAAPSPPPPPPPPPPTPGNRPVLEAPRAQQPVLIGDTIPRLPYDTAGDPETRLFRLQRTASASNAFRTYRESKPRPLRAGEFYSSGFLTDGERLAFGTLSGTATPDSAPGTAKRAGGSAIQRYTKVMLTPAAGATYAAGDTLLVVERRAAPAGFGEALVPTGMIRVLRQDRSQAIGEVVTVFGSLQKGQAVLAAPRFRDPGPMSYLSVTSGVEGRVLLVRDPRELRLPHQVLFLDVGRSRGVAPGDLFEVQGVGRALAVLQVVMVRERSATAKVIGVRAPGFGAGSRVRQVAKLGG